MLGPTARLCISYVANARQVTLFEASRSSALKELSLNDLIQAVRDSRDLKFNVSHTLFLIRRVELDPRDGRYLQPFIIEPMTSHVRQGLKLKLMEAQQDERIHTYTLFEAVPASFSRR